MKLAIVLVGIVSLAAGGVGAAWLGDGDTSRAPVPRRALAPSSSLVPVAAAPEQVPRLKLETKKRVGSFDLRSGKKAEVLTAQTLDGADCLIVSDATGEGSSCLDGGFFAVRRIELLVSSQGGPERFSELHVAGIVAPGIRSAELVMTDGRTADVSLNRDGAFLFESPMSDLERAIYPTSFRLYGPGGKLVETLHFPAGS